jgi:hypothetical protein
MLELERIETFARAVAELINEGIRCSLIKKDVPKGIYFKIESILFYSLKGNKQICFLSERDIIDMFNDERINMYAVLEFNRRLAESNALLLYSKESGNFYSLSVTFTGVGCEIFVEKRSKEELKDWILKSVEAGRK